MVHQSRAEAAKFINDRLSVMHSDEYSVKRKDGKVHIGRQELRDLLDLIYGGPPQSDNEKIAKGE